MNLEYLNTFIEVVKQGNISRAAKKLFLSQPAVSMQVQKLEKELGFMLVDRNTHHLLLTHKGKRFFLFAEYVYHEHKHLLSDIAQIDKGVTGHITATVTPFIGEFILPRLITDFKKNHPTIDINIRIMGSEDVIKVVSENPNGLGFSSIYIESQVLNYVKIGEDQTVLIVYPGHPFTIKKKVTLSDLVGEFLIFRTERFGRQYNYSKILKKAGIDLDSYHPKMIMGTVSGVLAAVENKTGIGFVSKLAIKKSEAMGLVKVIDIQNVSLKHPIYFIQNKKMVQDALLTNFISFINQNKLGSQDETRE